MESQPKTKVLLVINSIFSQAFRDAYISVVNSFPQIEYFVVTHPEYPEFATMSAKDEITILLSSGMHICVDVVMKECKNIKWFHAFSTGCETVIANQAFRESPITLTVTRGSSAVGLSEFALGAMLYFSRKFRALDELQKQATWSLLFSTDIFRKKIAIVGYGKIGSRIGRICKDSFEMTVVGVKNKVEVSTYKDHPEVEKFYRLGELGDACEGADFVVCSLPNSTETEDVFNLEAFKRMKKTAVFINIGRGSNVAEEDLIEALKKDIIGGAALDVFKTEPLPKTSPFYQDEDIKNKILISCHSASRSSALLDGIMEISRANLEAYFAGKPLEGVVDKKLGY